MRIFFVAFLYFCIFFSKSFAMTSVLNPYVGASFGFMNIDYKSLGKKGIDYAGTMPDSNNSYGLMFGFDLNNNFSFEFGYQNGLKERKGNVAEYGLGSVSSQITLITYDMILKLSLGNELDGYKAVGIIGAVNAINSVTVSGDKIDGAYQHGGYSTGWEYGFGLWKEWTVRSNIRLEYKKQMVSFGGIANGMSMISAGFTYSL